MGFVHVARHRSKPVQMWQHGDARVLLNRTRPVRDVWPRGEAALCAMALESADPGQSANRAQALLAPAIPRRYGPGEADLSAIAAPDGTSVFFCRTDAADTTSWLADFDVVAGSPAGADGVRMVDHVVLSQPAFTFDEAALFYQSVFGLHRRDSEDIADPYGLVRSRAVTTSDRRVRLVLNVPALAGGPLPESAAYQHVAFALRRHLRGGGPDAGTGLPTLSIPTTTTTTCSPGPPSMTAAVAALRDRSILYDRDERGGAFYHFYTAMFGRRLFFEIVQRVGGYDGYGTAEHTGADGGAVPPPVLAGVIG